MIRFCFFSIVLFVFQSFAVAQIPSVSVGKVIRHAHFNSSYVTSRHVDIWLPDGYDTGNEKYPVLYMHDGQMLFDSTNTWNHQEWKMDETAGRLIKEGKVRPFIIVGIWNGGETRHADYFPQKPFEKMSQADKDIVYKAVRQNGSDVFKGKTICSDNYLRFITKELKPFIDKTYRTMPDRKHTFIAGSSMGGLISMYAICEYPDVFGGAACISTHWPGIFQIDNNPIPQAIFTYLRNHLPSPYTHKFYFDHGTATLDAMYPALQSEANTIFKQKGFRKKNFSSLVFEGADHSEAAWSKRMHHSLVFLMNYEKK
jgi:predicted alpha/beta superfamily hydrolase